MLEVIRRSPRRIFMTLSFYERQASHCQRLALRVINPKTFDMHRKRVFVGYMGEWLHGISRGRVERT